MQHKPSIARMMASSALPILWSIVSPPLRRASQAMGRALSRLRQSLRRHHTWTIRGSWKT